MPSLLSLTMNTWRFLRAGVVLLVSASVGSAQFWVDEITLVGQDRQPATAAGWHMELGLDGTPVDWSGIGSYFVGGLEERYDQPGTGNGCLRVHHGGTIPISVPRLILRKEVPDLLPVDTLPDTLTLDLLYVDQQGSVPYTSLKFYVAIKIRGDDYWYGFNQSRSWSAKPWTTYKISLVPGSPVWVPFSAQNSNLFSFQGEGRHLPPGAIDAIALFFVDLRLPDTKPIADQADYGLHLDRVTLLGKSAHLYPPRILTQGSSRNVQEGKAISLEVRTNLTQGVTYQWYHNDVSLNDEGPFSGARTSKLTIDQIDVSQAGYYRVEATNSVGTSVSGSYIVQVISPITLLSHSASGVAAAGSRVVLQAQAQSGNPLVYDWLRSTGSTWEGLANNGNFIMSAQAVGLYRCRIRSDFAVKTTDPITLSLGTPTALTMQCGITEFSKDGGRGEIQVTAEPANFFWCVESSETWVRLDRSGGGQGSGVLGFTVDPLPGKDPRMAVITLGGQTLNITQSFPPDPSIFRFASDSLDLGGGFKWNRLGFLYDGSFPFVYAWGIPGWIYVVGESEDHWYFYTYRDERWGWTHRGIYPWYFSVSPGDYGAPYLFGQ